MDASTTGVVEPLADGYDRHALVERLEKHRSLWHGVLFKYGCRDRELSEDVIQDCYLRVLQSKNPPKGVNGAPETTWFVSVLRNAFFEQGRGKARHHRDAVKFDHLDAKTLVGLERRIARRIDRPDVQVEAKLDWDFVLACVEMIPVQYRACVLVDTTVGWKRPDEEPLFSDAYERVVRWRMLRYIWACVAARKVLPLPHMSFWASINERPGKKSRSKAAGAR
jgi:DNA-directed RNA polymerase specialized sigma24 family protein